MKLSIANHTFKNSFDGFINQEIDFNELHDVITNNHSYCACKLKEDYRLDDNFDGDVDFLILDIDEACTLDQAIELFKPYKFLLVTTKSHQKEKNEIICDRFRLFFPLDATIHIREHMEQLYLNAIEKYPFIDLKCKNVSRLFYASPTDSLIYRNEGKLYSTKIIYFEDKEVDVITPTIDSKPKTAQKISRSIGGWIKSVPAAFWWNEIYEYFQNDEGEVLEGEGGNGLDEEAHLKGIQKFLNEEYIPGNRAVTLFKCAGMMKNDGFDENYIIDYLLKEFNMRGGKSMRTALSNIKGAFKY